MRFHRSSLGVLGQCQYQLPGATPNPGIPFCSPSYIQQQEEELAISETTPYGGSAFGPGYSFAQNAAANDAMNAAVNPGMQLTETGNLVPVTPSTSSAPTTTTVPASAVTPPAVASPSSSSSSSAPPSSGAAAPQGCFQLFGATEPCWGPIGQYTALAGIAVILGLYFFTRR